MVCKFLARDAFSFYSEIEIEGIMRKILWLSLWLGMLAPTLPAGTIQFSVSGLGANAYRYTYFISGFALQANQELDIRFDPARYGNLTNAVAGGNFLLTLFQPNNPPGTFGDYSLLATVNNPSLAGPFSVDFNYTGAGQPESQPYVFNEYDPNGSLTVSTQGPGLVTTPAGQAAVPEPGSFSLAAAALLLGGAAWAARHRAGGAAA